MQNRIFVTTTTFSDKQNVIGALSNRYSLLALNKSNFHSKEQPVHDCDIVITTCIIKR